MYERHDVLWGDVHFFEMYIPSISWTANTVEPCTLAQSDHLWDLAVTKPMILSTKGINMTWCGYIGLQHIQKSAF